MHFAFRILRLFSIRLGVLNWGEELKTALISSRTTKSTNFNDFTSGCYSSPERNWFGAFKTHPGTFLSPHASIRSFRHRDIAQQFAMSCFEDTFEMTSEIQITSNGFYFQQGNPAVAPFCFTPASAFKSTQGCFDDLKRSEERGKC